MCLSLVAETCLRQKAVHSGSNCVPVLVTFPLLSSFLFTAPLSSLNTTQPRLLKHSATIAAGVGPSVRSAQGGGMMTEWIVCKKIQSSSPLISSPRSETVLVSAVERSRWVSVGCEVFRYEVLVVVTGRGGGNLWVASSVLIAWWARRGRGWGGGREVHSW